MSKNRVETDVSVTVDGVTLAGRRYTPPAPRATALLFPGAGGTFTADGLTFFARVLCDAHVDTTVINLTHNARRRPPRGIPHAVNDITQIVTELHDGQGPLIVGGKSFGSRAAFTFAAHTDTVAGVLAYGFPLHAPGRTVWRHDMFGEIHVPALFVSGSRDTFAAPNELVAAAGALNATPTVVIVDGGDHDCAVAKKHAPNGVRLTASEALTPHRQAIITWVETVVPPTAHATA